MASTGTQINTPVGRIVWGHPLKLVQRTDTDKKPILKQDGTPAMQTVFGLAIPKAEFNAQLWPAMAAEAAKGYPSGVPQQFSWKLDDGDGVDSNGKPFAEREGYAGHMILTIASNTGFPPTAWKWNGSAYDQMSADQIKTGDYIAVALNIQVNIPQQRTHTPSLYLNPQAIDFVGFGKEIVSAGVNPMAAFGGRQHALPPGASATPISSAPAGMQPPPGQQMQPPPQQQYQPPGQQMQPPPQQQYQPPGQQMQPPPQQQYQPPGQQMQPPPAHDFIPGQQPPGVMPPR